MPEIVDVGVIHGRFQVLHNDHLAYLLAGKKRCRHLVIGITNPDPVHTREETADPNRGRPEANPLTYYERLIMIRAALRESGVELSAFTIVPFPIAQPDLYASYVPPGAVYFLTIYDDWGREKLARFKHLGLSTEVLWERTLEQKGLCASDLRAQMRDGREWASSVPISTKALMETWDIADRLRCLAEKTT